MARKKSWLGRLLRWVVSAIAAYVAASVIVVLLLRWLNPPFTAFMAEMQLRAWLEHDFGYAAAHRWVDLEQISPNLALAVIASEDQKFPQHSGFDVEAIERAYQLNRHSHKIRGASTISQQVAKNLFLWSGRSYFRKGLEAYFTVLIEACWPKRRILEMYLNSAEFGLGVYGAEAAAQRFFRRPAARLTRSDAALLAAVLPNPQHYSAAAPSAYLERRRGEILVQMQALGGPEMLEEIDAYPNRRL